MTACTTHDPAVRRFVNRIADGRVCFKLQSACDTIQEARLHWSAKGTERQQPLERVGSANSHELFRVALDLAEAVDYVFYLHACDRPRWFTPKGLQLNSSKPAAWFRYDPSAHLLFDTLAWVRDAVFYQIFPERFCNGKPENDPPNAEPWGHSRARAISLTATCTAC